MSYSRAEILELSKRIGRSPSCLWRWASEGCDLRSHAAVQSWIEKNKLRETNVAKARRRRGLEQAAKPRVEGRRRNPVEPPGGPTAVFEPSGNGELPPAGEKGAAFALKRLESQEEEAHRRLLVALARGNAVEIDAAQTFWLKCSETLDAWIWRSS